MPLSYYWGASEDGILYVGIHGLGVRIDLQCGCEGVGQELRLLLLREGTRMAILLGWGARARIWAEVWVWYLDVKLQPLVYMDWA